MPLQGLVDQGQLVEQHVMCPVCHELVRRRAGSSKAAVAAIMAAGRIPLLLTDVQGAQQAKQASPGCMTLFLAPVSAEVRTTSRYNWQVRPHICRFAKWPGCSTCQTSHPSMKDGIDMSA